MKRIAFILLILFLVGSSMFKQLLKCRILIEHYVEHQQRNEGLAFIDFLSMHYWGKDINDNDGNRDKQLPFKSVDVNSWHLQYFAGFKPISIKVEQYPINSICYSLREFAYLPAPAQASLFRPPRI